MPPVSRCKAICGTPTAWVASIYLREAETRCCGVCARLLRGVIFTLETLEGSAKADIGRSGKSPGLPVRFPTLSAPNSAPSRFGKMPRAGAAQRVRKKSRIKRCHHRLTHRPAVRTGYYVFSLFQSISSLFYKMFRDIRFQSLT